MAYPSYHIGVFNYPGALLSAVYGVQDICHMANMAAIDLDAEVRFDAKVIDPQRLGSDVFDVIVIPPGRRIEHEVAPDLHPLCLEWLRHQHQQSGSILAASCVGVFVLAATGLIGARAVTTHWRLKGVLQKTYPDLIVDTDKLVINHGDIITAGGMMSWLDMLLDLVAQLATPSLMRRLGKMLVVDTGAREQRYYDQFHPDFSHGDSLILSLQHHLQYHYSSRISIDALASIVHLSPRTLQRRFLKVTGCTPLAYLQRLRIQVICDFLENTPEPFESIARKVGYEDPGACRKVFNKIIGLTPSEFRRRFRQ